MTLDSDALLNVAKIFTPELGKQIKALWNEQDFQFFLDEAMGQFPLSDGILKLLRHMDQLIVANYVPTQQHVLYARVKTTGIVELNVELNNLLLHIFDVGGARNERKKWIHLDRNLDMILFCVGK